MADSELRFEKSKSPLDKSHEVADLAIHTLREQLL